jgi:hypothetical protein
MCIYVRARDCNQANAKSQPGDDITTNPVRERDTHGACPVINTYVNITARDATRYTPARFLPCRLDYPSKQKQLAAYFLRGAAVCVSKRAKL